MMDKNTYTRVLCDADQLGIEVIPAPNLSSLDKIKNELFNIPGLEVESVDIDPRPFQYNFDLEPLLAPGDNKYTDIVDDFYDSAEYLWLLAKVSTKNLGTITYLLGIFGDIILPIARLIYHEDDIFFITRLEALSLDVTDEEILDDIINDPDDADITYFPYVAKLNKDYPVIYLDEFMMICGSVLFYDLYAYVKPGSSRIYNGNKYLDIYSSAFSMFLVGIMFSGIIENAFVVYGDDPDMLAKVEDYYNTALKYINDTKFSLSYDNPTVGSTMSILMSLPSQLVLPDFIVNILPSEFLQSYDVDNGVFSISDQMLSIALVTELRGLDDSSADQTYKYILNSHAGSVYSTGAYLFPGDLGEIFSTWDRGDDPSQYFDGTSTFELTDYMGISSYRTNKDLS